MRWFGSVHPRRFAASALVCLVIGSAGVGSGAPVTAENRSPVADSLIEDQARDTPSFGLSRLQRLAALSDDVVVGRVVELEALPTGPNGIPGIHTLVTLADVRSLKGTSSSAFWVQGGVLGGRVRRVTGQAAFRVGERVFVFLRRSPEGASWPTRMGLGKWRVEEREGKTFVSHSSDPFARVPLADAIDAVSRARG
jgi:hypothetical protein